MKCTIFKDIFSKEPNYISVDYALERVRSGKSLEMITKIRQQIDKERANSMKKNLPSVCFSGIFKERLDDKLVQHSGFIVLDFDHVSDLTKKKTELFKHDFIYAVWISPSGNGIKALVRIADGAKHREHFEALRVFFPDIDRSGVNPSRVCYESYDPDILINKSASPFTKIQTIDYVSIQREFNNDLENYKAILKWLSGRGDAFVKGERNLFIYKLASACCRFGISAMSTEGFIKSDFGGKNDDFRNTEIENTIRSAYKSNNSSYGTARFERDVLVETKTMKEVDIQDPELSGEVKLADVIFAEEVKEAAMKIVDEGYEAVDPFGIDMIDKHFKLKRGEITLLSGIGNYGKSMMLRYLLLMRALKYGDKFAIFAPEDAPAHEFYIDCCEFLLGCSLDPNVNRSMPARALIGKVYDWVGNHFFFVYPESTAPTPEYVKERFLKLIITQGVTGCIIDPFNQLDNDYGARSDKYLEKMLSEFKRFAMVNDVFWITVAHPRGGMRKDATGNYPCPDVYDIADGGMWNNKKDNILIYHRPFAQTDPMNGACEFHSKKIKKQKVVGAKGFCEFEFNFMQKRFFFNGFDPMPDAIKVSPLHNMGVQGSMNFSPPQEKKIEPISLSSKFDDDDFDIFEPNDELPF